MQEVIRLLRDADEEMVEKVYRTLAGVSECVSRDLLEQFAARSPYIGSDTKAVASLWSRLIKTPPYVLDVRDAEEGYVLSPPYDYDKPRYCLITVVSLKRLMDVLSLMPGSFPQLKLSIDERSLLVEWMDSLS
jgi:hypothetical protein